MSPCKLSSLSPASVQAGGMRKKHHRKSHKKRASKKASKSYRKGRRGRRGRGKTMKGGSVLGNALPSLVLFGLAKTMRGKKNSHNGNRSHKRTRKGSRKTRRM